MEGAFDQHVFELLCSQLKYVFVRQQKMVFNQHNQALSNQRLLLSNIRVTMYAQHRHRENKHKEGLVNNGSHQAVQSSNKSFPTNHASPDVTWAASRPGGPWENFLQSWRDQLA